MFDNEVEQMSLENLIGYLRVSKLVCIQRGPMNIEVQKCGDIVDQTSEVTVKGIKAVLDQIELASWMRTSHAVPNERIDDTFCVGWSLRSNCPPNKQPIYRFSIMPQLVHKLEAGANCSCFDREVVKFRDEMLEPVWMSALISILNSLMETWYLPRNKSWLGEEWSTKPNGSCGENCGSLRCNTLVISMFWVTPVMERG